MPWISYLVWNFYFLFDVLYRNLHAGLTLKKRFIQFIYLWNHETATHNYYFCTIWAPVKARVPLAKNPGVFFGGLDFVFFTAGWVVVVLTVCVCHPQWWHSSGSPSGWQAPPQNQDQERPGLILSWSYTGPWKALCFSICIFSINFSNLRWTQVFICWVCRLRSGKGIRNMGYKVVCFLYKFSIFF